MPPRTAIMSVSFTDAEKRLLAEHARSRFTTSSAWLRTVALQELVRFYEASASPHAAASIAAIRGEAL